MTFVDTSALYAVMDRDDQRHAVADAFWQQTLSTDEVLVTSNYVVVECFALVQSRLGMEAVRLFADAVLPAIEVRWVAPEDHHTATQAVMAAGRRGLSLVDCSSFQLMRRLGIRRAFSLDRHFAEQGFELVPGE